MTRAEDVDLRLADLERRAKRALSRSEIADYIGVTRVNVWQIERRALAKLRGQLLTMGLEPDMLESLKNGR